jgi:RNA polymerase sigma factor (sigma-70 family)
MTYRHEFAATPLLTAEQERALAVRIQAGDVTARNELVLSNIGLALKIAFGYARSCPALSEDDFVQEALLGLLHAARLYDPAKGRYSTNATNWVRACCARAIRAGGYPVRIPETRAQLLKREPKAVGDQTEWTAVQRWLQPTLALSLRLNESETEGETLADMLVDAEPGLEDEMCRLAEQAEAREQVRTLLAHLPARQRLYVTLYYGLDGAKPLDCRAIGRRLGCSGQAVAQGLQKGMARLRESWAHRIEARIDDQDQTEGQQEGGAVQ